MVLRNSWLLTQLDVFLHDKTLSLTENNQLGVATAQSRGTLGNSPATMENKGKIKDLILTRLLEKRSDDYLFVSHIPALLEYQITKEEAHLLIEEMFENP